MSSLTRSPHENITSTMALLRWPSGFDRSMAASIRSTSSTESTSGRCSPVLGDSTNSVGSSSRNPSRTMNLNSDRSPLSTLHCDTAPTPRSWSVAMKPCRSSAVTSRTLRPDGSR